MAAQGLLTFSLSPISPRTTSDILISTKVAPVSVAAAFARRVFPVPAQSNECQYCIGYKVVFGCLRKMNIMVLVEAFEERFVSLE